MPKRSSKPNSDPNRSAADVVARLTKSEPEKNPAAVALHFFAHNFIRPHGTLTKAAGGIKTTPAMAAGLTDRPWTMADLLALMDPATLLR